MILPALLGVASTLPLGPAGYSIVENSMNYGMRKGIKSLMELQVVELCYLSLGFVFFKVLSASPLIQTSLEWVALVFLICFGGMLLSESKKVTKDSRAKSTWMWAILNPGILLLYISVVAYFKGDLLSLISFQLGSIVAISVLMIVASYNRELLTTKIVLIKKIIGGLFICLGTFKFITII